MTEQDRLLELQKKHASKTRREDLLTVVLSLAFIFVFAILFFIIPDKSFSEEENTALQGMPKLQSDFDGNLLERISEGKLLDRLIDGRFTGEFADYYADQFPFRDLFVGLKGISEIALQKGGNNGAVLAKDDYIVTRCDYPDLEVLTDNLTEASKFAATVRDSGKPVFYAMAGRGEDVLWRYLPEFYPTDRSEELWNEIYSQLSSGFGEGMIDLASPIRDKINEGDGQYYYRTDHHWTTLGAYTAYCEIMLTLGEDPYPQDAFEVECATEDFLGTTWSSAGLKWIAPESIEYFRYEGDMSFTTRITDGADVYEFDGFYDRSYLSKKDKYSSFVGGNSARVDITAKEGERERLLIIKDSFAHSIAPFLARHYDLTLIDPRYYRQSMTELASKCDALLFLTYAGTVTESRIYGMLNLSF